VNVEAHDVNLDAGILEVCLGNVWEIVLTFSISLCFVAQCCRILSISTNLGSGCEVLLEALKTMEIVSCCCCASSDAADSKLCF